MNRRQLLGSAALAAISSIPLLAEDDSSAAPVAGGDEPVEAADGLAWHDVRQWGVEGRGFDDTEDYFDRLPVRAKGVVRDAVWWLQRHTAGMSAHFETDAPAIHVRYELTSADLAMPHMPATGVSGVDLYVHDSQRWRWAGAHLPKAQQINTALLERIPPARRRYHVNLPLYNGVKSLEVGVAKGASFTPIAPRKEKPILFYGTSITQGGCASRPGMAFVSILGRRLDRPVLNFGFSGNGRMEMEVVQFLAELDAAVFIFDCLANTTATQVNERCEGLVRHVRAAHPTMPILLLDDRRWDTMHIQPHLVEHHAEKKEALRRVYDKLSDDGMQHLHFRGGEDLIGIDSEATVDGSHPTDLGMQRYADALEGDLRMIIGQSLQ